MKKSRYLTTGNLRRWTEDVIRRLERSRARTRLPALDSSTALLLLDPQRIFISDDSPAYIPAWCGVKHNCFSLARHARERNRLVIVTRHVHPPEDDGGSILHFFGRLIREQDPLSDFPEEIGDISADHVLVKPRHSAFSNERLKGILRQHDTRSILICGVQTHLCVLATAVEAGTHDFIPVIVADATAAGNERQHRAALEALSDGIACIMTAEEVMEKWH